MCCSSSKGVNAQLRTLFWHFHMLHCIHTTRPLLALHTPSNARAAPRVQRCRARSRSQYDSRRWLHGHSRVLQCSLHTQTQRLSQFAPLLSAAGAGWIVSSRGLRGIAHSTWYPCLMITLHGHVYGVSTSQQPHAST